VNSPLVAGERGGGGAGVLPKPFTMAELRKRVADLIPAAG